MVAVNRLGAFGLLPDCSGLVSNLRPDAIKLMKIPLFSRTSATLAVAICLLVPTTQAGELELAKDARVVLLGNPRRHQRPAELLSRCRVAKIGWGDRCARHTRA